MLLTNHARVLLCLSRDPSIRMREIAAGLSVTERAVQRIVAELEAAGYVQRAREGRRNRYVLRAQPGAAELVEAAALADLADGPRVRRGDGIARNHSFID